MARSRQGTRSRFGKPQGFRRFFPAIGACLLCGLLIMGGMLLLVIPGIILACAVAVALPAVVLERLGPIAAIGRSWDLTLDHRLRIFAAWLAIFATMSALNMAVQILGALFGGFAPIARLVWLPIYLLLLPLPSILTAVAYHELRAEKEGVAPTADLARIFE